MKTLHYWINKHWEPDIVEDKTQLVISRVVIGTQETLDNKEQTLKSIPYCNMIPRLMEEYNNKFSWIMEQWELWDMPDINWLECSIDEDEDLLDN